MTIYIDTNKHKYIHIYSIYIYIICSFNKYVSIHIYKTPLQFYVYIYIHTSANINQTNNFTDIYIYMYTHIFTWTVLFFRIAFWTSCSFRRWRCSWLCIYICWLIAFIKFLHQVSTYLYMCVYIHIVLQPCKRSLA